MGEHHDQFQARLKQINRKHEAMAGGYSAKLRPDGLLVIKPGTLDDRSWLHPAGHIFTATKQPWIELSEDDGIICEDAPDMPALRERWSAMTGE